MRHSSTEQCKVESRRLCSIISFIYTATLYYKKKPKTVRPFLSMKHEKLNLLYHAHPAPFGRQLMPLPCALVIGLVVPSLNSSRQKEAENTLSCASFVIFSSCHSSNHVVVSIKASSPWRSVSVLPVTFLSFLCSGHASCLDKWCERSERLGDLYERMLMTKSANVGLDHRSCGTNLQQVMSRCSLFGINLESEVEEIPE